MLLIGARQIQIRCPPGHLTHLEAALRQVGFTWLGGGLMFSHQGQLIGRDLVFILKMAQEAPSSPEPGLLPGHKWSPWRHLSSITPTPLAFATAFLSSLLSEMPEKKTAHSLRISGKHTSFPAAGAFLLFEHTKLPPTSRPLLLPVLVHLVHLVFCPSRQPYSLSPCLPHARIHGPPSRGTAPPTPLSALFFCTALRLVPTHSAFYFIARPLCSALWT